MPKVTVIVPIYGVEKYIERCARSLFSQTLKDLEYIFIDDCSPDNSMSVLNQVLKEFPHRRNQVITHRMEQNCGLPGVRAWGVEHASGDYIVHCDSDDWVDSHAYEELYDFCLSGGYDLVWCDYYKSDGMTESRISLEMKPDPVSMISYFLTTGLGASIWSRIIKRELNQDARIIRPVANMGEDLVLSVQLALFSRKMGYYSKPLYYYFYNSSSIVHGLNIPTLLKNTKGLSDNLSLISEILRNFGLLKDMQKEMTCKKYMNKEILDPILNVKAYRQLWISVNSEVNKNILSNPYISKWRKFKTFCLLYHIFPVYRCALAVLRELKEIKKRLKH